MNSIRSDLISLVGIAPLIVVPTTVAQCAGYSVDILTGPACQFEPSSAVARAINNAGELCGGYYTCGKSASSAVWLGSGDWISLTDIAKGTLGFNPFDINAWRRMAGTTESIQNPLPLAAFYDFDSQTMTNLGTLPGDSSSEAFAISDDDRVVGYSTGYGNSCRLHAVVWDNGLPTALKLSTGPNAIAYGISDSGHFICGWMGEYPSTHFGGSHAFIWNDGVVTDLGTPDPEIAATEARAVNNLGDACGSIHYAEKWPTGYSRGFFWCDGKMQELEPLPGYERSFALDLNDSGHVIGYCGGDTSADEPFIWSNGVMMALDDLISAKLNLNIQTAWDINNAGQIVGEATVLGSGGDRVAVRLTPIPSPTGDSDCDNDVDVDDLLCVINHWADASPKGSNALPPGDFDHDGIVELDDLAIVLDNWTF